MTVYRSRRLNLKRSQARNTLAPEASNAARMAAAPALPAAPVELEWCSDFHDKNTPEETPPRFSVLSFIEEQPFMTSFLLIHVLFFVLILTNEKIYHLVASNMFAVVLWLTCVATVWSMASLGTSSAAVVFYQIDLESEQLLLHLRGAARGIRIMRLSFYSITSIRAFKYYSYSTTCGIDIGYLDERLKLRKLQVPDVLPESLAEAHMTALRPALGLKVEESLTYDN
ncbi:hypothetical protein [Massilia aquatica]|uniref:GPI-GlcNAc transferase complex PIG-H component conserved domain-containing protein n=1 Tax=Massilia aquatica TaxID=2609000 RepID=A0ABX0M6C6_9BURK|nr:hypothetical protein [Massilia aquatica]NHZ39877.1 hypothetical protein [Massilia aquatica]